MFDRIVHADWSKHPAKRVAARAARIGDRWHVDAPARVEPAHLVAELFDPAGGSVLAGFDFPIGVPRGWGAQSGLEGFRALLDAIGTPPWHEFTTVCADRAEISTHRPFFPQGSAQVRQADLTEALGAASFDALRRDCERGAAGRRAACPLFWTLGGNQVGRAALCGWQEVVRPALARGAALWPFDGDLGELGERGGVVLAETYPADAPGTLGVRPGGRFSKRSQSDRAALGETLGAALAMRPIRLSAAALDAVAQGFGSGRTGEDAFDAFVGLLAMIVTVETHPRMGADRVWEGGILGR